MKTEIIKTVRREIENTFSELNNWFNEDTAILSYKPTNGGWCGLDILEHVMLTSHYLLLLIDKAALKALKRAKTIHPVIDWDTYILKSKAMEDIGRRKSFTWIRPKHMEPTRSSAIHDIRQELNIQHDRCIKHLHALRNGEGVLCTTTMSVNNLGKIDVYQYLYFLALHAKRHLEQLEGNKNEYKLKIK